MSGILFFGMHVRFRLLLPVFCASMFASGAAFAEGSAKLISAKGDVRTRGAKEKSYSAVSKGASIADGSRLRTGEDGEAVLRFDDGTESTLRAKSEIIVSANKKEDQEPNGITLFFGRLWSKVAKASGGEETFEVRSANAVAGVRGTQFEVGVADDGSTRVVVTEGKVDVGGEDEGKPTNIGAGYEIESDSDGKMDGRKKFGGDADWNGWFSKRAKQMEKQGLKVAKALDGRLNRRKAKVEKLVAEQKQLRQTIEKLEAQKAQGADVDDQLQTKLDELERVTARLEDMKVRLEGAFGLFERWGAMAKQGGMQGGEEVSRMSSDIAKVAADFADMIEEGTDMSQEGMDEMMEDMKDVRGAQKKQRPKQNAKDELF